MFNLKIKDNLHISAQGEVWSYDTRVAVIKNGFVNELGKFTRTTTKHISCVSQLTGMPKKFTATRGGIRFSHYEYGVKCNPIGTTLSAKTSIQILKNMSSTEWGIHWSNLYDILLRPKDFPKKDLATIEAYILSEKKINQKTLQNILQEFDKARKISEFI